jgi:hypothetical protein
MIIVNRGLAISTIVKTFVDISQLKDQLALFATWLG